MRLALIPGALLCAMLAACSQGGSDGGDSGGVHELALRQTASGSVATVGQVNWYHYRAVETNGVLQVRCSSDTLRPDVEYLVTVYELDPAGNRVRIAGDHVPDESLLPADLVMNVYVDQPKDLYIAVRDLLDDEASPNSYYLSVDFVGAADEDGNFANALPLAVDGDPADATGTIGHVGDVDCYTFQVETAAVYAVTLDFTPFAGGTDVALTAHLYDSEGDPVAETPTGQRTQYRLLPYLEPGTYYLVVEDLGRDDFDPSSPYRASVQSQDAAEVRADDTPSAAVPTEFDAAEGVYAADGAIAYLGDEDWYLIPAGSAGADQFRVLEVSLEEGAEAGGLDLELTVVDEGGEVLLSHRYPGGSAVYRTQLLAGQGAHYVGVGAADGARPSAVAPYTLRVGVAAVDDPGELGAGNDTLDAAEPLASASTSDSGWTTGKIAYRGDEDWYRIDTDTAVPRVLEVFLETDAAAPPDYALSVIRDGVLKKVYDSRGEDGPTRLKASLFVPAGTPPAQVTYFFRVYDFQGDEGSVDIPYRIRCNVTEMPQTLPADANAPGAVYHLETDELGALTDVRLELTSLDHREYALDTGLLRFNGADPAPGIIRETAGGLTTITSPWIGGYVDYQGDQDWFEVDLGPLVQNGIPLDSQWYYELQVEFYTPGSAVEPVWKLYRDENQNGVLVDRANDSSGFFASAGDGDPAVGAVQVTAPEPGTDETFWVGDAWEGKFYLSVSDFQFAEAAEPDDDWGYDAPYYFRLRLVYHPGVSHP